MLRFVVIFILGMLRIWRCSYLHEARNSFETSLFISANCLNSNDEGWKVTCVLLELLTYFPKRLSVNLKASIGDSSTILLTWSAYNTLIYFLNLFDLKVIWLIWSYCAWRKSDFTLLGYVVIFSDIINWLKIKS